ncbi:alpha/beta hydrolase, partial [Rhizobium leguminosarum]|nr:alpha/beta hydrolase [Rhizobium leguminosarum]
MINHTSVYSMPGTCFFDLAPAAGGEPYRIFLSIPAERPPMGGWPLLVLTDGNATFPFAVASLVTQAPYPTGTNVGWGVIAAIGYPSDEPYDPLRRSWDLGPPPVKSYPPFVEGGPPVVIGGTGKLLDFIENELIPRIAEMVI